MKFEPIQTKAEREFYRIHVSTSDICKAFGVPKRIIGGHTNYSSAIRRPRKAPIRAPQKPSLFNHSVTKLLTYEGAGREDE